MYRLEEQLLDKIHEVLPKESVRTIVGDAEVLKIFELGDKHKSVVAGMSVQSGSMRTEGNYEFVLLREKEASENDIDDEADDHLNELDGVKRVAVARAAGTVASLRRFKDNVTSVPSGQECGLIFPGYRGVKVGDRVVCYELSTAVKKITLDENRFLWYCLDLVHPRNVDCILVADDETVAVSEEYWISISEGCSPAPNTLAISSDTLKLSEILSIVSAPSKK